MFKGVKKMKEIIYHPAYSLIKKLNDKGQGNTCFS